jgi:thymidine phosphorylase
LRDATATVRSAPLIAASVMSKKLAVSSDLVLLDVKAGSGAFMRDVDDAVSLAQTCLEIARAHERRTVAAVTDMSQPLGEAIGNALEIAEAIEVLRGRRRGRLRDLAVELAARSLTELTDADDEEARRRAAATLTDGSAVAALRRMVEAQGGDPRVVDAASAVLPTAPIRLPISAPATGTLASIDAAAVAEVARALGAGRARAGDAIDPAVGIVLTPKVGDRLERAATIGAVHARDVASARTAADAVGAALTLVDAPVDPPPLVHRWIEEVS